VTRPDALRFLAHKPLTDEEIRKVEIGSRRDRCRTRGRARSDPFEQQRVGRDVLFGEK